MLTISKTAALLAAASSVAAIHSHANRKTLSFGADLTHRSFNTDPVQIPFANVESLSAQEIAEQYLKRRLRLPKGSYRLRDDSYQDKTTGVWHLYYRQLVLDGALEVSDGDINLNVLNGQVISYGDSFYRGPSPSLSGAIISPGPSSAGFNDESTFDQQHYCAQLRAQVVAEMTSASQIPLGTASTQSNDEVMQLYENNCKSLHLLDPAHFTSQGHEEGVIAEAKDAALYFLVAAHPEGEEILSQYTAYRSKVHSSFENHLHGHGFPIESLSDLPGTESPVKAFPTYMQTPCTDSCVEGQSSILTLVWKLEVEMPDNWYEAYVDAFSPTRIMKVVDWVSDAKPKCTSGSSSFAPIPKHPKEDSNGVRETVYRVWPWGVNDPSEGERDIVKSPYDVVASPIGWHSIPEGNNPSDDPFLGEEALKKGGDKLCNFTTTWGNNVQAQENWEGRNAWLSNGRPEGNDNLTFVFPWGARLPKHANETVPAKGYVDLVVTQLFYTVNMIHDLYYRYGFDEVSGNFQNHNFGKGGKEDDGVIANAQDGSGYNNANFATPPDGQRGKMRMYIWNTATPERDGDLEAGIVIHEYSHGLSTRLTGGPSHSGCLGWGESGGMGEGWGDFLATTIRSTANYSDFAMGAWAANRERGIRNYVYSLDNSTNPSTYKTLDGPGYWGVHAIGEVWAEMLWVVSHLLIEKHGFSDSLFPPQPSSDGSYVFPNDFYNPPKTAGGAPIPKHGNTLAVQLVLNGMKLQPCSPKFFNARDAILQADMVLTGGENQCEIWTGFARTGLGPDAEVKGGTPWGGGIRKNDYGVPARCAK